MPSTPWILVGGIPVPVEAPPDVVLDEAVLPAFRWGAWALTWFRVFQQGSVQTYLMYIFVALIALLFWIP